MNLEYVLPEDIERRSFEIIESELHGREFPEKIKPVMYRVCLLYTSPSPRD